MADATKVYDLYAPILNYKEEVDTLNRPAISLTWVPSEHQRRIKAYEILHAYWNNFSRDYRKDPESGDTSQNDDVVEVGDAAWLCDKLKSRLIGDEMNVTMPIPKRLGSEDSLQAMAENQDLDEKVKRLAMERLDQLKKTSALLTQREAYIQAWWDDFMVGNIIQKNESKISYLGDGVYYVGWNAKEKAPELITYDAGFCFPYDYTGDHSTSWEDDETEVSKRFILAWQEQVYENDELQDWLKMYVEVWELRVGADGTERAFRRRGYFKYTGQTLHLQNLTESSLLDGSTMDWDDMGVDFIPFVWVANMEVEGEEPFGISNLHHLVGIMDNMQNSYTDLSTNAEYLGGVVLALSGENIKLKKDSSTGEPMAIEIQPKAVYNLGKDGSMDVLDTSKMQEALLKTIDKQDDRFLRNANLPDVAAGRIEARQIPSGVALRILMQPLIDKIQPMREQRQQAYSLMFYYVQKMWQINGDDFEKALFGGDLYDAILNFGDLLPDDEVSEVTFFVQLSDLIGDEATFNLMKERGWQIDVEKLLEAKAKKAEADAQRTQSLFDNRLAGERGSTTTSRQ